jgi:hypothetical protein
MLYCKECGKPIESNRMKGMCQTCYNYFRNGGTVNPIPEHGKIEHDVNGKIICHICGRAYTRLGSHVKEFHNMTIEEYKEQFGLCKRAKTTEQNYSNKMSAHAKNNNMDKQLIEAGKNTRIKKGDTTRRKNKEVRLQERLDKRNRKYKSE